ncbi:MAG: hypothetical protein SEPTF4163_001664 [Sporothrix epigloea]
MARQGHGFLTILPARVVKTDNDGHPVKATKHKDTTTFVVVAVPDSYWGERPKADLTTRMASGGDNKPAGIE